MLTPSLLFLPSLLLRFLVPRPLSPAPLPLSLLSIRQGMKWEQMGNEKKWREKIFFLFFSNRQQVRSRDFLCHRHIVRFVVCLCFVVGCCYYWIERVMLAIQSLRMFVSKDSHHPTPSSTLFVVIARFHIQLCFFVSCTMRRQWEKSIPRQGHNLAQHRPACIHSLIIIIYFFVPPSCPSLLPFSPPIASPTLSSALYLCYHTQPGIGKNKGDKKKVPRHPSKRQTQNSIPGVYLASLQVMPYFPFFSHSLPRWFPLPFSPLHSFPLSVPPSLSLFWCNEVIWDQPSSGSGLWWQAKRPTDWLATTYNRPIGTIIYNR